MKHYRLSAVTNPLQACQVIRKTWNITASSFILVNQTFHTCWSSLYFLSASPLFMKATPAANEFSICSAHLQSIGEIIQY